MTDDTKNTKSTDEIRIPRALLNDPRLSARALLLFGLLRADQTDVTIPVLATKLGVSPSTVMACLRELRDAGIVGKTQRNTKSTVTIPVT